MLIRQSSFIAKCMTIVSFAVHDGEFRWRNINNHDSPRKSNITVSLLRCPFADRYICGRVIIGTNVFVMGTNVEADGWMDGLVNGQTDRPTGGRIFISVTFRRRQSDRPKGTYEIRIHALKKFLVLHSPAHMHTLRRINDMLICAIFVIMWTTSRQFPLGQLYYSNGNCLDGNYGGPLKRISRYYPFALSAYFIVTLSLKNFQAELFRQTFRILNRKNRRSYHLRVNFLTRHFVWYPAWYYRQVSL